MPAHAHARAAAGGGGRLARRRWCRAGLGLGFGFPTRPGSFLIGFHGYGLRVNPLRYPDPPRPANRSASLSGSEPLRQRLSR